MESLGVGFSSCPNDTFMFHALVHGLVGPTRIRFDPVMEDIEALNQRARAGGDVALPITKLSVSALGHVLDRYAVLRSGAALGRGCGPLVVRAAVREDVAELGALAGRRVAIPGLATTAWLLLRMFGPAGMVPVSMRFDAVMPAVARGEVDAGLVIHESRFTYGDHGLARVADLGELWEADTGLPLPLGVIVASRSIPAAIRRDVEDGLRASVEYAFAHPSSSRDYVRAHARELSDEVCKKHIDLYVNRYSVDLQDDGWAALETLLDRGRALGVLPPGPGLRGAPLPGAIPPSEPRGGGVP